MPNGRVARVYAVEVSREVVVNAVTWASEVRNSMYLGRFRVDDYVVLSASTGGTWGVALKLRTSCEMLDKMKNGMHVVSS